MRSRLLICICLIIGLLIVVKIFLEIGNTIYKKRIKQMQTNKVYVETTVQHKLLEQDGYNISYFVSGNKQNETILLLHPAFSDHTCFDKQIDFFSKNYHVIAVDLLGHGLSKTGKSKDKIDKSAEHIFQILQQENIEKTHITGVSMGSLIAQYFALQYPNKTLSLAVLGGYNINHANGEISKSQSKEMFKWVFKIIFSMDSFRRYTGSVSALNEEEQMRFYESAKGFTRKSLVVMSGMDKIVAERENIERTYPLLILIGDKDIDLAKKAAIQWHEEDTASRFQTIENSGHCANMDNSEEFNRMLFEFIDESKNVE